MILHFHSFWNFYSFAILEFILNFRLFWTFHYSNIRYFGSFNIAKFYRYSKYSLLSQFSLFKKFALVTFWQAFLFRVGSYEEADETDTYGTFNNGTTNNDRPVLRTQSTVDETTQGTYEGFKGSLKGLKLYWSQFLGLLVKRLIYTKRRYLLYGILVSQNSVTFEKFSFPPLLFWFLFIQQIFSDFPRIFPELFSSLSLFLSVFFLILFNFFLIFFYRFFVNYFLSWMD